MQISKINVNWDYLPSALPFLRDFFFVAAVFFGGYSCSFLNPEYGYVKVSEYQAGVLMWGYFILWILMLGLEPRK